MPTTLIQSISTHDLRFTLEEGAGADSVHSDPQYSYAVTRLDTNGNTSGIGLAFTLGGGNDLVCRAIDDLARILIGREIEDLMADFATVYADILEHPQYRWLGPHKGVVHLALSSIVNACWDLWAKAPWSAALALAAGSDAGAVASIRSVSIIWRMCFHATRRLRFCKKKCLGAGHEAASSRTATPATTPRSAGFSIPMPASRRISRGRLHRDSTPLKLKVGSDDPERDIRRAFLVREAAGADARVMLDVNQQWTLPQAIDMCARLRDMNPYWIEEPTHPDDVLAHQTLSRAIEPLKLAIGEHVPNQVVFKNYLQANAAGFLLPDCARLGGVSEFISVSLLARKFGIPVAPHVGDMGQIHQHLALFNHIALGHQAIFLEYIPHMREHFAHPARVENGVYATPQEAGQQRRP